MIDSFQNSVEQHKTTKLIHISLPDKHVTFHRIISPHVHKIPSHHSQTLEREFYDLPGFWKLQIVPSSHQIPALLPRNEESRIPLSFVPIPRLILCNLPYLKYLKL